MGKFSRKNMVGLAFLVGAQGKFSNVGGNRRLSKEVCPNRQKR